ncbi:hypothetical protein Vi05172_g13549 [Venturia inaequalis]|nr:hypothetical protein Vi05172_g13549 [Venturia inaequalis]
MGIYDSGALVLTLKNNQHISIPQGRNNPLRALSGISVAVPKLQQVSQYQTGNLSGHHKHFSQFAIMRVDEDIVWIIFPVLGLKVTIPRRASATRVSS